MKKLLSIILILAMLFSFAACGQGQSVEQSEEKMQTNIDEMDFSDKITLMYYGKVYKPGEIIETDDIDTITVLINGTSTVSAAPFEVTTDEDNVLGIEKYNEHALSFISYSQGTTIVTISTSTASENFIITGDAQKVDLETIEVAKTETNVSNVKIKQDLELEKFLNTDYNQLKINNLKEKYGVEPKFPLDVKYYTEEEMDKAIKRCCFAPALSKRTLSAADARELVYKDSSEIAEAIHSVVDAFVYLKTAGFKNHGDVYTSWYPTDHNPASWGYDHTGEIEIYDNDYVCCGGMSNMGAYVLAGDYDEVGVVKWVGDAYHVINYVKQDGVYYMVDFVSYDPYLGWKGRGIQNPSATNIEDIYEKCFVGYREYHAYQAGMNETNINTMVLMVADEKGEFPCKWDNKKGTITFPLEAQGKVQLSYYKKDVVTDPEHCIKYEPLNVEIPGWNADYTHLKYTH